eukprot:3095305-Amphidinium_carterae.2
MVIGQNSVLHPDTPEDTPASVQHQTVDTESWTMTVTSQSGSPPGNTEAVQNVLVNSGSEIHVCPPEFWPSIPVKPAKSGLIVRRVGGHRLKYHGQKTIWLKISPQVTSQIRFEVADVQKPMLSVKQLLRDVSSEPKARTLKSPVPIPAPEEVAGHHLTHLPYQPWCLVCRQARIREDNHGRVVGARGEELEEKHVQVQLDYTCVTEGPVSMTVLTVRALSKGWSGATMVPALAQPREP